ncbi:MAG: hypothetical protein WCX30_02455 [Candidatus Paceibacterota bacterium]|jgi:uncharacterized UPF0160 family protein|nr:hypothetical protein [bacterium]
MNFKNLQDKLMAMVKSKYFLGGTIVVVIVLLIAVLFFKNIILMNLASVTKNPSFCDSVGDSIYRDTCYFNFALHDENFNVCDKMNKDLVKNLCRAIAKRDATLCNQVNQLEAKDACYLNINRFKPDISICPRIENENDKDDCFSFVAKNKKDVVICENIKNDKIREDCKASIR